MLGLILFGIADIYHFVQGGKQMFEILIPYLVIGATALMFGGIAAVDTKRTHSQR